jgi:hypothetical protein
MSDEPIQALPIEETVIPKKEKKKRSHFMSDEAREEIQEALQKSGVAIADLGDEELVKKMTQIMNEEFERRVKLETEKAITPLNFYASDTKMKDKAFIERLYKMNVPRVFLKAFTDEDTKLENQDIWRKVRESGITQLDDVHEIFKDRSPRIMKA